jgi:hypothetical protein
MLARGTAKGPARLRGTLARRSIVRVPGPLSCLQALASNTGGSPNAGLRRKLTCAFGSLLVAGFVGMAACGPSVQSIYEGNVRFEHCYRLDLDVDIAATHRAACWKEWLGSYTYGQPRDRIDYATRRIHAFASGDTSRPELDIGSKRKPVARQFYLVVPTSTSVYSPPAPVATPWDGDAGSVPDAAVSKLDAGAPIPGEACRTTCAAKLETCRRPCETDAAKPAPRCKTCAPDYKACMRRCFE